MKWLKRLAESCLALGFILLLSLVAHTWILGVQKKSARILFARSSFASAFNQNELRFEVLKFLRGDWKVDFISPPLKKLSWTLNIYTGQILPWQSQALLRQQMKLAEQKKSPEVVTSGLKNF